MRIIITEDQVNLLNEGTNKSVRLLKKYYDIIGGGGRYEGQGKIRTVVSFLRKDSDDDLNHSSFPSYGFWGIGDDDQLIFRSVTLPKPENIPLMEYIGNTDELKEYLKDLHREEAEDILKRINHRRNNPLNESVDKKKKFLINHMGQDFTGKIKEVKDQYDVPMSFDDGVSPGLINLCLNHWGPMYLVDIDGKNYLYQDRSDDYEVYEWFHDENGFNYVNDEITEQLGISDMGLKFSNIIDTFYNQEGEPLNEEENDKPDWLRENTKVKNLLKKLFENKEYEFSFKDKWEDLDGHIETYTFHYHIEILNTIGVGSDTIARVQVIIDDILLDGESVYDGWVEIGYSNNVWYINNLENHLDEEFFDVFPFSIYVNFYGHDEEM
jgi:hypothetical protein